jgi:pantetheine-phosphate adenylyltransferase
MKTAIYPGTFDPITYGHVDVITKSLNIFDRVVVATTNNLNKNYYFSIDERLDIINNSLFKDLKLNKKKIKVIPFDNLTIDLCKKYNANTIIRGLRAVSDFEYEFQLAGMNKKLNSKIETMFLMSDVENQIISSKFVKEIATLGGNIDRFVTKYTVKMLKNKFQ